MAFLITAETSAIVLRFLAALPVMHDPTPLVYLTMDRDLKLFWNDIYIEKINATETAGRNKALQIGNAT
jgi:hypothetical protein